MTNESSNDEHARSIDGANASRRWRVALILVLVAASYCYRLGSMDFFDTLEVRRVLIARDMLERGDWLVPHLKGNPQLTKPPLVYWAMASVGMVTGTVNETTARIPSVIAGLCGIVLVFLIGKRLFDETTGLLAAVILATTSLYYSESRYAELDSALVTFSLLSIWAYWQGNHEENPRRRLHYYLLFFAAMGLAFMSKGPLGIVVPLAPACVTLILLRDVKRLRAMPWLRGIIALLCVILPWVIVLKLRAYPIFAIFKEEMGARFSETFRHQKPFKFYVGKFDSLAFPWSFLMVPMAAAGVAALVRARKNLRSFAESAWRRLAERGGRLLYLLLWFLGVTLLLSIMPVKRDYYFLPAIPAWALLSASFIAAIARRKDLRWARLGGWHVGGVLVLAGLGFLYLAARTHMKPDDFSGKHFLDEHLLLIICGTTSFLLALLAASRRLNVITSVVGLAAALWVGQFYFAARYTPLLNSSSSPKDFCQRIRNTYRNAEFIAYREDNFAIQYYLGRNIEKTDSLPQIKLFLGRAGNRFAVTTMKVWQEELLGREFETLLRALYTDEADKAPVLFARRTTSFE